MSLAYKKKQLELRKVETARLELEFRIEERNAEIERLHDNIKIQSDREEELKKEIKSMEDN